MRMQSCSLTLSLPRESWLVPTAIEYWCDDNCLKDWHLDRDNQKQRGVLHFRDSDDAVLFQLSSFTRFIMS